MQGGKLRHRVTIQEKSVVQDSFGEETITWQEVATVWAAVEPLMGREFHEGRQYESEVTTRVRIRRRAGVVPEMRVVYGSKVFDVQAVLEVREERREILLMCKELPNN